MKRSKITHEIYVLTSPSKKQYVGITMRGINTRLKQHINDANQKRKNRLIGKAIRKYGGDAFSFQILDITDTLEEAKNLEIFYIKKLNTLSPHGYNMTINGRGGVPRTKNSLTTRKKISESKKRYYSNPKNREAQSIRMSKIQNTPEGKERQRRNALKQNAPEKKEKIRKILKILRSTPEYKKTISISSKKAWPKYRQKWLNTYYNRPLKTCPHCGHQSRNPNIDRFHFDNCKKNPNYIDKRPVHTCEYCGFQSKSISVMKYLHGDNCKHKK